MKGLSACCAVAPHLFVAEVAFTFLFSFQSYPDAGLSQLTEYPDVHLNPLRKALIGIRFLPAN